MSTTRRTALALSGAGIIGTLVAGCKPSFATESVTPALADLIEEHRARIEAANAAAAYQDALSLSPDAPPFPEWKPSGRQAHNLGHYWPDRPFRSSEALREHTARAIEAAPRVLLSGNLEAYTARINQAMNEGLAVLEPMEASYAPIVAAEKHADERVRGAWETFDALVGFPCSTLADVRAKATALMLEPDWLYLDEDEPFTLLRSLMAEA